ncbi:hypothetical protein [Rhizobium leguminosarum]|uniref:hypothetical protein n=1 Tax=Rhizobium leguminosarum TaxID=384 RepID=UPI003F969E42
MFAALPSFGRFVSATSEWTSVPLGLIPFGYKMERRIVDGRRQYRVSGPDLPETLARSTEHGRWIIGEHARKARLARTPAELPEDEDEEDTLYYADAFVGVAYDESGELLVCLSNENEQVQFGYFDTLRDIVDPILDWIVASEEVIVALSEDGRGLLFDLNDIHPFSFIDGFGSFSILRFSEPEAAISPAFESSTTADPEPMMT